MQWNPWHGCHKCSPGCMNCYVYYLDKVHGREADVVTRSKTSFYLPVKKTRQGGFKVPPGTELATCFTSDFFIEEADPWRNEAWDIIRRRREVDFLICTKRIHRFEQCKPPDWGSGYDNVIIAVTCENQEKADERLPLFTELPIKRKYVFVSPMLERVNIEKYLKSGRIDTVSAGGESYENARECDFEWIKELYKSCIENNVKFDFHQTGSNFIKDGRRYRIDHSDEYSQAEKGMEVLRQTVKKT